MNNIAAFVLTCPYQKKVHWLSLPQVLDLGAEIADGLDAAHQLGIVLFGRLLKCS